MPGDFRIRAESGVVHVVETGTLDFATSNRAVVAGVEALVASSSKRLLFDLRGADLSNYYSYIVRHAETAAQNGLDASYAIALVGPRDRGDVLSFIEKVARNRGWRARAFFDLEPALDWLDSVNSGSGTDP